MEPDLKSRYGWRRVEAPKTWNPRYNHEELVGYYGGRTKRDSRFGQYEVVIVHVPQRGSFAVSGTRIVQLIDAAMIGVGHPIRIVWLGYKVLKTAAESDDDREHKMKLFDVFVAEGDPLDLNDLPSLPGQPGQHG